MSLAREIENFQNEVIPQMKSSVIKIMGKGIQGLIADNIGECSLQVGHVIPSFSLPDVNGNTVSSDELLKSGPLVISFYRGGWCPYCNLELAALQGVLHEIEELGGTLIAISPENPVNSLSTLEKNELKFSVLNDSNNEVARTFGLVFDVPYAVVAVTKKEFGMDLKENNGTAIHELPIPATYLVGTDGVIKYAFVDVDYSKRAEPSEIVKILSR